MPWLPGDLFASHLCHLSCIRPTAALSTRERSAGLFSPTSGAPTEALSIPHKWRRRCDLCRNLPSLCAALMSSCKNTRVSHRNVSCCTYALRVHYTDLHSAPLKRSFVNTSYLYLLRNPLRRYSFTSSFGPDSIHYLGNVPAKRVFASLRIILLITPQIPCDLLLRIIFCAC